MWERIKKYLQYRKRLRWWRSSGAIPPFDKILATEDVFGIICSKCNTKWHPKRTLDGICSRCDRFCYNCHSKDNLMDDIDLCVHCVPDYCPRCGKPKPTYLRPEYREIGVCDDCVVHDDYDPLDELR